MDDNSNNVVKRKGAGRDRKPKPDLENLDGFIEKIVQVPKKELDDLLAAEPKRKRTKKT